MFPPPPVAAEAGATTVGPVTSVDDAYNALKQAYPLGTVSRATTRTNGDTETTLRIKLPMSQASRVIEDLGNLGVTIEPANWEEASLAGPDWTGQLHVLATTTMGARLLALTLLELEQTCDVAALLAGNPAVSTLETAGEPWTGIDWDSVNELNIERDVHWALVCLAESAGRGRTFADPTIELDEPGEILATLLADTASGLGLDLDDWYAWEELHHIIANVDPAVIAVARGLAQPRTDRRVRRTPAPGAGPGMTLA